MFQTNSIQSQKRTAKPIGTNSLASFRNDVDGDVDDVEAVVVGAGEIRPVGTNEAAPARSMVDLAGVDEGSDIVVMGRSMW